MGGLSDNVKSVSVLRFALSDRRKLTPEMMNLIEFADVRKIRSDSLVLGTTMFQALHPRNQCVVSISPHFAASLHNRVQHVRKKQRNSITSINRSVFFCTVIVREFSKTIF